MIFVIGDVMLDKTISGHTSRISPEAPVPIVRKTKTDYRLGGAANVANLVSNNAFRVCLVGQVGNDEAGSKLIRLIEASNIQHKIMVSENAVTTCKTRILSDSQQICRIDTEAYNSRAVNTILDEVTNLIDDNDIVILSDYSKGFLSESEEIIHELNKFGAKVIVDAKCPDPQKYAGAYIVKPNIKELSAFCRHEGIDLDDDSSESIVAASRQLIESYNVNYILTTRAEKGSILVGIDCAHEFFQEKIEVVDVVGAGDTVAAFLAMCLQQGCDLHDAVSLSMEAGRKAVQKLGTSMVTFDEIRKQTKSVISSVSEVLAFHRQFPSKRMVFTNGCFDILHSGHVKYLTESRSHGDFLVVGINSDASVKRLKGNTRPVNTLEDRCTVLASLSCVDFCIPFDDDTPIELITSLKPKVLTKGSDYKAENVVGNKEMQHWDGEVKIIDLQPNISTTNLIRRLNAK